MQVGRHGVVQRPALFELLSAGRAAGVTVVSAPAGSGKTELVESWLQTEDLADRAAWVRVEREEQDPQRFWLSVVAALRSARGTGSAVERLEPAPTFDGRALVERLASELVGLTEGIVLVIDDLHELQGRDALRQLELFLTLRPPRLTIVLVSRSRPRVGLHRLRLTGGLTEIRPAHLQFTLDEARALLLASGVELAEPSLAALHERTEGWAAGLRLAALALRNHPEPERFVSEFSGSVATLAEFLLAEVLGHQPPDVRRLLLRTSILERIPGGLADRLTGEPGSLAILQTLEDENAFVLSTDAGRTSFRYHRLFADLLRLELRRTEPDQIPDLHRAASDWYSDHGDVLDAVRHAQEGRHWEHGRHLLVESSFALALDGHSATVLALLESFPKGTITADAELALVAAGAEVWQGSMENAKAYLRAAEARAEEVPDNRRPHFRMLLSLRRLMLARRQGDLQAAISEGESLLAAETQSPDLADEARASALTHLGIVELWTARFSDATRHLEQALELAQLCERPYLACQCLAHLSIASGRESFEVTRRRALEAIELAEANGWDADRVAAPALLALAGVDVWQGHWEDARRWLARAERTLLPTVEPTAATMVHLTSGRLHTALGEHQQASRSYRAAAGMGDLVVAAQLMTAAAQRLLVQSHLALGDTAAAADALAKLDEDLDDDAARVARAHLHLAHDDPAAAGESLAPLLSGEVTTLPFLLVEAFLVDAVARDRLGEIRAAELDVERALELAEPSGLIWPFVASPARELLERHQKSRTAHTALLRDVLGALAGSEPAARGETASLREPLSESELRVLRYLTSNLRASEIARELYVSVHTVKTHMRHVYTKLAVHSRSEAVERARELGLIGASARIRQAA